MSSENLSRRAILAGVASVSSIALPVVVAAEPARALSLAVAAATQPADPVIAIAEEAIRLYRVCDAGFETFDTFEEAMFLWLRENPQPQMRAYKVNPKEALCLATGKFFDIDNPAAKYVPDPDMNEAIQEHKAAVARWKRRERDAKRRTGYRAAKIDQDSAGDASVAAIEKLIETRPRTFAGLVAKARAVLIVDPDDCYDWPLAEDISALAELRS
jgi:hypothetical protein